VDPATLIDYSNWSFPTDIRFGAGRIAEIADICVSSGIKRPLLVTDSGLAELSILRDAATACEQAGLAVTIFSDIKSNPIEKNVADGVAVLQAGNNDGSRGRCGTLKTLTIGGREPTPLEFCRSSPYQPPPEPDRKWVALL